MVEINYLKELLPILKANGVLSFTDGCFSITIDQSIKTADYTIPLPVDESKLPPDIRTDSIHDYDKIMNWSGSPEEESLPLPGVNDELLTDFPDNPSYQALREPMPVSAP